jgi:hypothetical protein
MNKRFIVRLSAEERTQFEAIIAKGKGAARRLSRARILPKADCSSLGPEWSDQKISDALDLGVITVHRVRRSFVERGVDGALVRRPLLRRPRMLDGEQEAHLIALVPCQLDIDKFRRIDEVAVLRQEVGAWESHRNRTEANARWRFTTEDARIKLEKLYPVFEYPDAHGNPPQPNLSKDV